MRPHPRLTRSGIDARTGKHRWDNPVFRSYLAADGSPKKHAGEGSQRRDVRFGSEGCLSVRNKYRGDAERTGGIGRSTESPLGDLEMRTDPIPHLRSAG